MPPPPEDEILYVERPAVYFDDPIYDLPPPPPIPVYYLEPQLFQYDDLPPPPPPEYDYILPIPVYYPVPEWVERPVYVAPPPINIISVNIHNTVVMDQVNNTTIITDRHGERLPPVPAGIGLPRASVEPVQAAPAPAGKPNLVEAHPVASAAIEAAAVALPAALRARAERPRDSAAPARMPVVATPQPPAPGTPVNPASRPQPLLNTGPAGAPAGRIAKPADAQKQLVPDAPPLDNNAAAAAKAARAQKAAQDARKRQELLQRQNEAEKLRQQRRDQAAQQRQQQLQQQRQLQIQQQRDQAAQQQLQKQRPRAVPPACGVPGRPACKAQ